MKTLILATLALGLNISSQAVAGEYENWMGSAHSINCKGDEIRTVSTSTDTDSEGFEYVESFEVKIPKRILGLKLNQKFVIKSVKVDILSSDREEVSRPILVEGEHHRNGDRVRIEIDATAVDADGFAETKLFINENPLPLKNLKCNVLFAG